jgi:hypothetical protein
MNPLVLITLGLATPSAASHGEPLECALQFGGFVDGTLDSIVYLWSASKRCDKSYSPVNPSLAGIACAEDVASSIQSGLSTLDNLVSMLKPCGWVKKEVAIFGTCVDSIGGLLANSAGLAASAAKVADHCTLDTPPTYELVEELTPLGKCLSDIGDSAKSLLALSVTLNGIAKHSCKGKMCTAAILVLIHVASQFGEAFALAFDHCSLSPVGGKGPRNQQASCAGAIFGLTDGLTGLAAHGYLMSQACKTDVEEPVKAIRRYIESNEPVEDSTTSSSMTLAIAAAIPLAAVVSFVGGMRFTKSGQSSSRVVQNLEEELE